MTKCTKPLGFLFFLFFFYVTYTVNASAHINKKPQSTGRGDVSISKVPPHPLLLFLFPNVVCILLSFQLFRRVYRGGCSMNPTPFQRYILLRDKASPLLDCSLLLLPGLRFRPFLFNPLTVQLYTRIHINTRSLNFQAFSISLFPRGY